MSQLIDNPKRRRSALFFHTSNILGVYEMHVGYKSAKGNIQPLSIAKHGSRINIPFGPPVKCQYSVRSSKDGNDFGMLTFHNIRKQIVEKPASLLNSLEFAEDRFSKKVTSLTVEGKKELLMLYLSKLNFVEGFVYHREGIHSPYGSVIGETSDEEKEFQDMGGSMSEFKYFVMYARECAKFVENNAKSLDTIRQYYNDGRKRKCIGLSEVETNKKSKQLVDQEEKEKPDSISAALQRELEDKDGLPVAYQKSLCGVVHIPLENISVSSNMGVNISDERVELIKESILKRYNPAISVLVVCPKEKSSNLRKNIDYDVDQFYVVQKVKCLLAFKKLDKVGDFVKLYGHHHRKVLCYVRNSNSPALMQYANLNENYLTSQFSNKPLLQDLFHHCECLIKTDNSINALKVVERMGRLCCFRYEDCLAVLKICRWSGEAYKKFMDMLKSYEKYETKDATRSGYSERISKGLKRILPNSWIKKLSKITEQEFVRRQEEVLNYSLPLKDLADQANDAFELQKVSTLLSKIANCTSIDNLRITYPGRFDDVSLKDFIGAISDGSGKNQKAVELENYYDFVTKSQNEQVFETTVVYQAITTMKDAVGRNGFAEQSDMLIYNLASLDMDVLSPIIQSVLSGRRPFKAVIILCSSMDQCNTVSSYIKSQSAVTALLSNYKFVPLYFKRSNIVTSEKVGENLQFGILFGSFIIREDPLLIYYSDVNMVQKVVKGICPLNSRVDFLADPGRMLYKVHNKALSWKVRYFATPTEIERLRKKLKNERECGDESEHLEMPDDSNIPSTSSTPSKVENTAVNENKGVNSSGVKNLNDSGFDVSSRSLFDDTVNTMDLAANFL